MICNELFQMEGDFAVLMLVSEQHQDLVHEAEAAGAAEADTLSAQQRLLRLRLDVLAAELARHVREHNCAN